MEINKQNNFIESYKLFWDNIFEWGGRTRRSDFWQATIINFFICLFVTLLELLLTNIQEENIIIYSINLLFLIYIIIFSIIISVGTVGLFVRRLHDIGMSGLTYLIILLPCLGEIVLFIYCCKDSQHEENEYGISPKYIVVQGNNDCNKECSTDNISVDAE